MLAIRFHIMNVNDSRFNTSIYLKFIIGRIILAIQIIIIVTAIHDQEIFCTNIHDIKNDVIIIQPWYMVLVISYVNYLVFVDFCVRAIRYIVGTDNMLSIFQPAVNILFLKNVVLIQVSKNYFVEVIWYFDKHVINVFIIELNLSFNVNQIGLPDVDYLYFIELFQKACNFALEFKIFHIFVITFLNLKI